MQAELERNIRKKETLSNAGEISQLSLEKVKQHPAVGEGFQPSLNAFYILQVEMIGYRNCEGGLKTLPYD